MPATCSFAALGTTALVALDDPAGRDEAEALLHRHLDDIDRACSRFRDDSELTRLNRAAGRPVEVSPLLMEAILTGLRAAALTDGDVDPTVGNAMRDLGYDRDFTLLDGAPSGPAPRPEPVAGWRTLRIDRARRTVALPAGASLDLGATAKAFAADRAAQAIHEATGTGTLVSLGGDIALAGPAPAQGWAVRVTDDHRAADHEGEGETLAVHAGGLATSSTTVRRWRSGDAVRHHVVDPRLGVPAAEVWRTVSVAAATCVDANIASTASIVRGGRAPRWLAGMGLPARLVTVSGEVVRVGGWPEPPS